MTDDAQIRSIIDSIDELPSLPDVVITVNRMLRDPHVKVRDVSLMIGKDMGLVAKILKLVNSAFFGLRSKVSNLPDAISLLGFDTIHRITVSLSVIEAFPGCQADRNISPAELWGHAIRTGVYCEALSRQSGLCHPDDAFIAGLLHDLGIIAICGYLPDVLAKITYLMKQTGRPFFIVESSITDGLSHADIGARIAARWQFPDPLTFAIRHHHSFPETEPVSDLLAIVHTANVLDTFSEVVLAGEIPEGCVHPAAAQKLSPQLEEVSAWFTKERERAIQACKTFLEGVSK